MKNHFTHTLAKIALAACFLFFTVGINAQENGTSQLSEKDKVFLQQIVPDNYTGLSAKQLRLTIVEVCKEKDYDSVENCIKTETGQDFLSCKPRKDCEAYCGGKGNASWNIGKLLCNCC